MNGVKYTELGFEGRCDECLSWWPLDATFWPVPALRRVRICTACRKGRDVGHSYHRRTDRSLTYQEWLRTYKRNWMRRKRQSLRTAA